MKLTLDTNINPSPNVLTQDLDDELVFLDIKNEQYFGLEGMGSDIWQALTEKNSLHEAIDSLIADYDVTREQLEQDILKLVEELIDNELVEVVTA